MYCCEVCELISIDRGSDGVRITTESFLVLPKLPRKRPVQIYLRRVA